MPVTKKRCTGWAAAGACVLLLAACAPIPPRQPSPSAQASPGPEETGRTTGQAASDRSAAAVTSGPAAGPTRTAVAPGPASLVGDTSNAWAFAPLDQPQRLIVEGRVPSQRAWSTSKVLVVAGFLAEACDGDPDRATATQRRQMERALSESDMNSLTAIANAIPGGKAAAMTAVLRSVGDVETTVPRQLEGTMTWSVQEQIRFLVALHDGRVVSPEASRYLLKHMQPIESQSWGLGTVGATAYKGGWLRSNTETRQMGILDGYAVAIITRGIGPVQVQSDGDSAHVQQMNLLAAKLQQRLTAERGG